MPIGVTVLTQTHRNNWEWWQVSWHSSWGYRRYGSLYHFPMIQHLMGLVAMGSPPIQPFLPVLNIYLKSNEDRYLVQSLRIYLMLAFALEFRKAAFPA